MQQSRYTTQEMIDVMRAEIAQEKERAAGGAVALPGRRAWKHALKIAEWAVFLALFAVLVVTLFGVYTAKAKGKTPAIFGVYQLYSVETGSMEPTLTVGSVIVCKTVEQPDRLAAGQIVTFRTTSDVVVTHRIIEVVTQVGGRVAYRTKGDNPINSPDVELLTPDRVVGVFTAKIPFT